MANFPFRLVTRRQVRAMGAPPYAASFPGTWISREGHGAWWHPHDLLHWSQANPGVLDAKALAETMSAFGFYPSLLKPADLAWVLTVSVSAVYDWSGIGHFYLPKAIFYDDEDNRTPWLWHSQDLAEWIHRMRHGGPFRGRCSGTSATIIPAFEATRERGPRLLTASQVARILNLPASTVAKWASVENHGFPQSAIYGDGVRPLWHADDLADWLHQHRAQPWSQRIVGTAWRRELAAERLKIRSRREPAFMTGVEVARLVGVDLRRLRSDGVSSVRPFPLGTVRPGRKRQVWKREAVERWLAKLRTT